MSELDDLLAQLSPGGWSTNPLNSLTLPSNAGIGARIVIDGSQTAILFYNSSNVLIQRLDPNGLISSPDLSFADSDFASYISVEPAEALLSGLPVFAIHPGFTTISGAPKLWDSAFLYTTYLLNGTASAQRLEIQSPTAQTHTFSQGARIQLSDSAFDLTDGSHIGFYTDRLELNGNRARTLTSSGKANLTGGTFSLPTTSTDVPGCTLTITTQKANAQYCASIVMDAETGDTAIVVGQMLINGSVQTEQAIMQAKASGVRACVSQTYRGTLTVAGSYTFKMQAFRIGGTGDFLNGPHTNVTVDIYE